MAAICHHVITQVVRGENVAVTSKHQVWHQPSLKHQHDPDFLRNITIKKVKGNCQFENVSQRGRRFDFDPRVLKDRKAKQIGDLDWIGLNRASDGSAAIPKFFTQSCAIYQEAPDLNDAAVVQEETVVATEEKPMPLTLLDIASNCNSSEELMEAALVPIPWDDVVRISEATMQQRDNEVWFDVRAGRITASILKKCIDKVDVSNNVKGDITSYVKQIMNYYPKAHSPAINWGVYNEAGAISDFL